MLRCERGRGSSRHWPISSILSRPHLFFCTFLKLFEAVFLIASTGLSSAKDGLQVFILLSLPPPYMLESQMCRHDSYVVPRALSALDKDATN